MVGVGDERDAVHDGETRRTLRSIGNKILDNIHDKNNGSPRNERKPRSQRLLMR